MNNVKNDGAIHKVNKIRNIFKNYNSYLYPNSSKFEKNKNEINKTENNFINIDANSYINKINKEDVQKISKEIEFINENKSYIYKDGDGNIIKDIVKYILAQFLSKLYPKCYINIGNISHLISKEYYNKNNFSDKKPFKIEENINYFFNSRFEYKYSKVLKINKSFFVNCGKILIKIYSTFKIENITDSGGLKSYRNKILEKNLNVLTDFYSFCSQNGYDPSEVEKTFVWKNLENRYNIPPEFIFLFNIFQEIIILELDLEFCSDILNEEDFTLFAITILNAIYIFQKLDHIKLNLINTHLQCHLYKNYYPSISNLLLQGEETIKKNNINNNLWLYGNKWNLDQEFNYEKKLKKMNENKFSKYGKIVYDKYSMLYKIESIKRIKLIDISKEIQRHSSLKLNNINNLKKNFFGDFENISLDDVSFANIRASVPLKKAKENNNYSKDSQIFLIYNVILLIICSFTNFKKFELITNDFYTNELFNYLKENLKLQIPSEYTKFHILNLLYSQLMKINLFNTEINSLDDTAFKKILKIISKNSFLTTLKISLFSCNSSYLILSLFKIYEKIKSKKIIEDYISEKGINITYENIENKIVNDLSSYFIENLGLLFKIIKNKVDLKELGFDFDMPNILINNNNYIIPIYKFIINILLLIDNNEKNGTNKIEKLIILSRNTKFDARSEGNINSIFKNIQVYKNCKKLKEFDFHCQFYKIIHINNIISINLIKLSIGDLDSDTFSVLVHYLNSYEFSNKSSLQNLNIKLMDKITEFNVTIKYLLQTLFYIKIKNLLELKLFSNINIKDAFNYAYLIKLLKYNWIPYYTIVLNKNTYRKSDDYMKDISFLIFPTIVKNSSDVFEVVSDNKNENKKDYKNDNEIFWILKYIFICKYSSYHLNFFEVKNIIYNIGQFLYSSCKVKISNEIE